MKPGATRRTRPTFKLLQKEDLPSPETRQLNLKWQRRTSTRRTWRPCQRSSATRSRTPPKPTTSWGGSRPAWSQACSIGQTRWPISTSTWHSKAMQTSGYSLRKDTLSRNSLLSGTTSSRSTEIDWTTPRSTRGIKKWNTNPSTQLRDTSTHYHRAIADLGERKEPSTRSPSKTRASRQCTTQPMRPMWTCLRQARPKRANCSSSTVVQSHGLYYAYYMQCSATRWHWSSWTHMVGRWKQTIKYYSCSKMAALRKVLFNKFSKLVISKFIPKTRISNMHQVQHWFGYCCLNSHHQLCLRQT